MGLTGWCIVVRQRLLKLFTLCQVKSDLVETWFEWYDNKGLQSYGADFEYLHQLDRRGPQNTLELFQPRGSLLCDSVTNAIKNMSFISSNIVSGTFWVKNRTSRDTAIGTYGTYQIIESSCVWATSDVGAKQLWGLRTHGVLTAEAGWSLHRSIESAPMHRATSSLQTLDIRYRAVLRMLTMREWKTLIY